MLVCAPTGAGKTVVGEFAVHLALAEGRKCFYTTPIKALSNQKFADLTARYGADAGRPAHRRHLDQRRRARRGDDHRGAAQHAVRGLVHAGRPRLRGDGRGPLPGRPVPRRRVGGGHPAPARARAAGRPVGDGQQRRGVRRLAGRGPRRHHGRGGRAPAGAAVAAHAGRRPAVRPVRRRGAPAPGQQGEARRDQPEPAAPHRGARPRAHVPCAAAGVAAPAVAGPGSGRRPGSTSWSGWTPRPAAGHRVRVQPGRLRRRRRAVRAGRDAADHAGRGRRDPRDHRRAHRGPARGRPRACWATGSGARRWSAASPATTPACCRRSRRPSRSCSSAAWSRPCSPPRRWRWASTCRPARSCWSGWSSTTARRTST